ncbi:MAG: hypothetical protein IKV13_07620 [Akkermansia sp.]|nr:hypothetical protein [Akkermansia sp.]
MNHLSSISRAGACMLLLALSSCYPQTSNPDQLRLAHEQNAALRQEIVRMQQLINQSGETEEGLADTVEAKEQELTDALNELKVLKRQETEHKLRLIELQDRLDAFRSDFRIMQNETAKLHKRS